jgi:LPS-assembly protein
MRIPLLALVAALGGLSAQGARGQPVGLVVAAPASSSASSPTPLQSSPRLMPLPRGDASRRLPIVLQAQKITTQPDLQTVAEGDVEFRRGGLVIQADRLSYDTPGDLARAQGHVKVSREGAVYSGPELEVSVQRFEGFFLRPEFEFMSLGAGGSAQKLEFLGNGRTRATGALYTSCPRDSDGTEPAWVLRTDRVTIDLDANEGIAEGAVLRFLGTPILAMPTLSFPLGDSRKSGWLPPSMDTDNRSGLILSVPYYWNIAPNRDATLAPRVITRRGFGLDTEFRYLEPGLDGSVRVDWLPHDRVFGRSRNAVVWTHEGQLPAGFRYDAHVARVSDPDWWKDFPDASRSFTARLLPVRLGVQRPLTLQLGDSKSEGDFYARLTRWQVLQASDSVIDAPYERTPQVGLRMAGGLGWGFEYAGETEFNRFTLPGQQTTTTSASGTTTTRATGDRWHVLGSLSRPWREPGWWVVPKIAMNAAAYDNTLGSLTTPSRASRVIPSFSLDTGVELERSTEAFGRRLHQTLEPRFLYVNTPYRLQSNLPNYDSAAKDFNFVSLFSDNAFSGVDRVSDSHQLTAGFTTRLVDAQSGAEALRLGLVQRMLFRTQRITAQADGTPDGDPLTQRFSDALLVGSTSVLPGWTLDGAVQYSTDLQRSIRSIVGARYSPGPYRTVSATYRLARGLSEQMEVGWQWPILGEPYAGRRASSLQNLSSNTCSGTWYTVGRFNYSMKDRRVTDSVLGLEYDAGCWIGRLVAQQVSTGQSQATTRLSLQLELVGLSRIGSNPLKVLKDNIPGYRLLRDERTTGSSPDADRP